MIEFAGKTVLTTLAEQADPKHTALLVIDIQNHTQMWDGPSRPVLDRAKRIIAAAERAGVMIVYFHNQWDPDYANVTPAALAANMHRDGFDPDRPPGQSILSTTASSKLHPQLKPRPQDHVIAKTRPCGFVGTGLGELLKEHGVQSVVCIGHATDACVAATAFAAHNLDYYTIVVADAVCGGRVAHGADGDPMLALIGWWMHVPDTRQIIEVWDNSA